MNALAGTLAPKELLIDVEQLKNDYLSKYPDMKQYGQHVRFGTSGHRGTPFDGSFTQAHIQAIVQAIIDYRQATGAPAVLYMGKDTHAVSDLAQKTALGVLAANGIRTIFQKDNGVTPTPVISHAILSTNREKQGNYSDGIIITSSHNPPSDGGIKYNPPHGGPADTNITQWIEKRANEYLKNGNKEVHYQSIDQGSIPDFLTQLDFAVDYINDLENIVDVKAIRDAGLRLGVDPLGGASIEYWGPIAERYGLDITIVNDKVDPTFYFVPIDHDGKIRMDCSSPYPMKNLVARKNDFDLSFGNDPDSDRHGIVVPEIGLLSPNHNLSVSIDYLVKNRPNWPVNGAIGKTLVSSSMIDRVAKRLGRRLVEVPVGFKWFVPGLNSGTLLFGGEESAGASFLRFNGQAWSTDKDGIILDLLAAEILARTGRNPGLHYQDLEKEFGSPVYRRVDQPATPEEKLNFTKLTPDKVSTRELAGEAIQAILTNAPGNNAPIGGLKVVTENGWFAARPSGTENIYKIYAESFLGEEHLVRLLDEARILVTNVLK